MTAGQVKKTGFNRKHLIVMALGNIIGSGIFLASGIVISLTGPAAVIAYMIGGLVMLLEVMFIAEMSIVNPAPGAFRVHASEVFGPGVGFVNGWMFWCSGVLGMASEVTAAAIFSAFWFPSIPLWLFCLVYSIVMTFINFMDVRGLSRFEAWLASIKIIALIVFILFGFLAVIGVLHIGLPGAKVGFSSLNTFLPGGFKGLWASMLMVLFSFTGTGIIGMAVADMNNPAKDLPPAIYVISAATTVLYSASILFIVLLVPWNTLSASESPFVVIMQNSGIPLAGTILNVIVLTASLSGLNSSMYSASRMLASLSRDRQGPKKFLAVNKNGVPVYALTLTSGILALTAVLSYILPERVFIILTGASGFTAMVNWLTISVTHIFYRKKTLKERPEKLQFKVPGYPWTSILAIVLIAAVLLTSFLYPEQISSLLTGIILIAVLMVIYIALRKLKVLE
ncbi:MAG: amino acid permease [Clostridia bacterium]|nr:amino acid permease [Clostridia bacterium]